MMSRPARSPAGGGDAVGVDGGGDQPLRRLSMQQSPTGGRCIGVERATYQRMSKSQWPPRLEQGLGRERVTQPGDIADVEARTELIVTG